MLATGILPPAEALKRVETLVQLSYQAKDYAGAVAYGERYYKEGGSDDGPRLLWRRPITSQNDFANAARTSRVIVAAG